MIKVHFRFLSQHLFEVFHLLPDAVLENLEANLVVSSNYSHKWKRKPKTHWEKSFAFHFKTKLPLPIKIILVQAAISLKLINPVWNKLLEKIKAWGSICALLPELHTNICDYFHLWSKLQLQLSLIHKQILRPASGVLFQHGTLAHKLLPLFKDGNNYIGETLYFTMHFFIQYVLIPIWTKCPTVPNTTSIKQCIISWYPRQPIVRQNQFHLAKKKFNYDSIRFQWWNCENLLQQSNTDKYLFRV